MFNPGRVTRLDTSLLVSSPFYFGDRIAEQFASHLKEIDFDRCFLVSSEKLIDLFGRDLLQRIQKSGADCSLVQINDIERFKNWDTLRELCEELVARGVTKDSVLIALGGGMVGNVVGLAAALVYRGIRFVHVPTTLTAQSDSTLSNKQAINGARGKNQFGVYHAPLFVWADAAYSRGEPRRQQQSGIVEGIKNVLISHDNISGADQMLDLWTTDRWAELTLTIIQSKLQIIRDDPTEKKYGIILEYGHTFGHAIEWLSQGRLLHGEAVSIGMCLAAELSNSLGHMSDELLREHYRLLGERLGAPTRLPEWLEPQAVYNAMLADNKRTRHGLRFLLLRTCGQFVNPAEDYMTAVEPQIVLECLRRHAGAGRDVARAARP
ncbi:MAG TPA: iron-containing alcohol dehydrogenase [Humisphaera sp.]|jgi:3-dehydroquinate synthetase|nr:iron-containing alcohol dehydrogenase [Humisphaera sp.]